MQKKMFGLLLMMAVAGLSSWVWAEAAKEGAACSPKNSEACQAPAAAAAPAEAKPAAPAPAAPAEAKPETAAAPASLAVEEMSLATGVENRAPVGAAESFPAGTEKLYCYTKLTGGKEGDTIVHKWSHDGAVVSEVTLKVNGSPWRTFSSKTLGENAAGAWTVDVLQNGTVLKTLKAEVAK